MLLAVSARPLDHGSLGLVGAYVEITSTEVRAWMERARGVRPEPGVMRTQAQRRPALSQSGQPSGGWTADVALAGVRWEATRVEVRSAGSGVSPPRPLPPCELGPSA